MQIFFPEGLDKLSFDYRKAYTNNDARQLEILADGVVIHTTEVFGNASGDDPTIHNVNLTNLELSAGTTVTIKNVGSTTTNRQVVIDNFKWTENVVPNVTERLQVVRFNYLNNRVDTIVYAGDNVLEPTLPTLETHEFEGWYTDYNFTDEPFDIDSPIESNIELFAKWLLIEEDETQVIYNIDFGEAERKGYSNSPVRFTNTWDNLPYTLDKDRFQINGLNINQVGVLAPVKDNSYAYVEFDLTGLSKEVHQISFDYGTWNSTSLTNLLNENREAFFGLQVFIDNSWITLESNEGITNLKDNLIEQFQTVTYNVGGNYKYRVVLNTPGAGTNTTNTGQAGIIDNFKAIHHSSGTSLNPIFITPDTHTYYAEQNKSFEPPALYALDRYGRYIEADLISGYGLEYLGESELEYEAIDFDGLTSTYKVTLIVIEELPIGELPEMDEENLQELKNSFATARNNLPAPLGIPYDPLTYYADLNGLTGEVFKQVLQNILEDTHVRNITYDQARFILEQADAVQTEIGTYLHGIYSNHRIVRYWDGGTTWAREHVWPNSKLGIPRVNGSSANLGSDVHNLRVINPSVNSSRSNRYFDIGHTGTFGTIGTEAYDPGRDHRGDVARIIFYMYVRYNDVLDLSSIVDEVLAGDAYTTGATTMGLLNVLIQWHNQDPVDDFEINRNNVIFSYQGNRNPFIDNPDYVVRLFPDFS
jgi:endonuclease I